MLFNLPVRWWWYSGIIIAKLIGMPWEFPKYLRVTFSNLAE